jgi:hypothetical protein
MTRASVSLIAILLPFLITCSKEQKQSPAAVKPAQPTVQADALPQPASEAAKSTTNVQSMPAITPYPASVSFCSGRVYASPEFHISWEAFHTATSFDDVVQHYAGALGTEHLNKTVDDARWAFPKEEPTRVLHVESVSGTGPWKSECGTPNGAVTVITVSEMPR